MQKLVLHAGWMDDLKPVCTTSCTPRESTAVAFLALALDAADDVAVRVDRVEPHVEAPQARHVLEHLVGLLVQRPAP